MVERAIDAAAASLEGKNRKGRALVVLATTYLEHVRLNSAADEPPVHGDALDPAARR